MVGVLDIRMAAPAGSYTGGTKEDKKVPPKPCPATVTMPANSCSHPKPSSYGVGLSERVIPQARLLQ